MYDKFRLYSPRTRETPDVTPYLERLKNEIDLETGEIKTFGRLDGLRVGVFSGGVSIEGSLAKYMYGNNIASLDRRTTATAIEKLSDELHLDLNNALVTSLEFGTNFAMSKSVEAYLCKLRDLSRMIRSDIKDGAVYYKPRGKYKSKILCFYDKIQQAERDGMPVPVGLDGANLLRYELRLRGRLKQQLKVLDVTASTLSDKDFYEKLVRLWQNYYFAISKATQATMNDLSKIKSVSGAFNALVARLISQSEQDEITAFLAELKNANVFDNRVYYSRLKQKINAVVKNACFEVDTDMQELDDAVKNAGTYI